MPSYYPYGYYPQQVPQQNQSQQSQNGIISVPSEDIVATYPVAPGNCVMFKIEGKPIVMEKSMGFSQFEPPRIERYRLVKEEATMTSNDDKNDDNKLLIKKLKSEIEALWDEIEALKDCKKKVTNDDAKSEQHHERDRSAES